MNTELKYRLLDAVTQEEPVVDDTPFEIYQVNGYDVHVKREDLSCPLPGPQFSKIRGLYAYMQKLADADCRSVGILDTIHSKAGWAVAYIGNLLGIEVYDFFPIYKSKVGQGVLSQQHQMAASLGAILVPLRAAAGYVLEPMAKKLLAQYTDGKGHMLPVGLKMEETIEATADEILNYTPDELLFDGSWVISSSSGTIASGVWLALQEANSDVALYCHSGYGRKYEKVVAYIETMSGYQVDGYFVYIDENYQYKDKVDFPCPFPCNPYYDLKAWKWLCEQDLSTFRQPIVFWNIGA